LNGVAFFGTQSGCAVGDAGTIVHTTNGGATWTPQTSGTQESLYAVTCADENTCWAVGGTQDDTNPTQVILKTVNGGASWTPQMGDLIDTVPLFGVTNIDTQTAWAVGDFGIILGTTDGGTTWVFQESGVLDALNAVAFATPANGWAVGDRGTIVATTTGGR